MGLGDYPLGFWGLGQGNLAFRGGAWGLPFRFFGRWHKGTCGLGVGLGTNLYVSREFRV